MSRGRGRPKKVEGSSVLFEGRLSALCYLRKSGTRQWVELVWADGSEIFLGKYLTIKPGKGEQVRRVRVKIVDAPYDEKEPE